MKNQSQVKTINWGIIGLGSIANKFATDLLTIPDAKLYAVASRSQDKADLFADKYSATKAWNQSGYSPFSLASGPWTAVGVPPTH